MRSVRTFNVLPRGLNLKLRWGCDDMSCTVAIKVRFFVAHYGKVSPISFFMGFQKVKAFANVLCSLKWAIACGSLRCKLSSSTEDKQLRQHNFSKMKHVDLPEDVTEVSNGFSDDVDCKLCTSLLCWVGCELVNHLRRCSKGFSE